MPDTRRTVEFGSREVESVTSRDENDQVIAREVASREKFEKKIEFILDGHKVLVPLSTRVKDHLGNVIREADGGDKPRNTTIYDAAQQLVDEGKWSKEDLAKKIPVLCHRDHLTPVAVCRMCSVHVCKKSKRTGRIEPNNKLVPACQHEIQEDMSVTTWCGGTPGEKSEEYAKQVASSVRLLSELLVADHRPPDPPASFTDPELSKLYENELDTVVGNLQNLTVRRSLVKKTALTDATETITALDETGQHDVAYLSAQGRNIGVKPVSRDLPSVVVDAEFPYSSRSITIDHNRCILCDRCVRSCSDVKPFKVIGHTGKGYSTRISFDLDLIQNESSCVQCGECMTACPTGALTLKRRVAPAAFPKAEPIPVNPKMPLPEGFLSAKEMKEITLEYYDLDELPNCKIPDDQIQLLGYDGYYAAMEKLKEQKCRKQFKPFDEIPYSYLRWNEGAVRRRQVRAGDYLCRQGEYASTAFFLESGRYAILEEKAGKGRRGKDVTSHHITDIGKESLIFGELACLNNLTRTRSVKAIEDGVVYEVTRNILDQARRSPTARYFINTIYRKNALRTCVQDVKIFEPLSAQDRILATSMLNEPGAAEFKQVEPGELIVREGDLARDFYMIFRGFVKFVQTIDGVPRAQNHLGKGDSFGELALLAKHPEIGLYWYGDPERPLRTASAIALDPVEIIRIPGDRFRELCEQIPAIMPPLVQKARQFQNRTYSLPKLETDHLAEYLDQGLYQGQSLLVLDLMSCTRCDECTRACADSHGGTNLMGPSHSVSRLLREGQRFGDFLVATSCRSCHKPYCMEGCPVDAINRSGTSLEIRINPKTCIGCSLCEQNCPYGAIQMVPKDLADLTQGLTAKGPRLAVDCDLCQGLVPEGADTFCVAACPHDAAHRLKGEDFLKIVKARS